MMFSFRRIRNASLALSLLALVSASASGGDLRPVSGSSVVFHAHSTGHDFDGRSAIVHGRFGCDRARLPETAYGELSVPIDTLHTGIAARDAKMLTVFDTPRHPAIGFRLARLEQVRWTGTDTFTATAVGTLSMHGVSLPRTAVITGVFRGDHLSIAGHLACRITEFGMERPGFLFVRVADEVRVDFRLEGAPAPAGQVRAWSASTAPVGSWT